MSGVTPRTWLLYFWGRQLNSPAFHTEPLWQLPDKWDTRGSVLSGSISAHVPACFSYRFCCFSWAHTHPREGLPNKVSEAVNVTWQCVAPSNKANVTLLIRSQTRGRLKKKNIKISHLVRTIGVDVFLIFLLSSSLLTSPDITPDDGECLTKAGPRPARGETCVSSKSRGRQRQKETSVRRRTRNLIQHQLWVHSSERERDTSSGVRVLDKSRSDSGDRKR